MDDHYDHRAEEARRVANRWGGRTTGQGFEVSGAKESWLPVIAVAMLIVLGIAICARLGS